MGWAYVGFEASANLYNLDFLDQALLCFFVEVFFFLKKNDYYYDNYDYK